MIVYDESVDTRERVSGLIKDSLEAIRIDNYIISDCMYITNSENAIITLRNIDESLSEGMEIDLCELLNEIADHYNLDNYICVFDNRKARSNSAFILKYESNYLKVGDRIINYYTSKQDVYYLYRCIVESSNHYSSILLTNNAKIIAEYASNDEKVNIDSRFIYILLFLVYDREGFIGALLKSP